MRQLVARQLAETNLRKESLQISNQVIQDNDSGFSDSSSKTHLVEAPLVQSDQAMDELSEKPDSNTLSSVSHIAEKPQHCAAHSEICKLSSVTYTVLVNGRHNQSEAADAFDGEDEVFCDNFDETVVNVESASYSKPANVPSSSHVACGKFAAGESKPEQTGKLNKLTKVLGKFSRFHLEKPTDRRDLYEAEQLLVGKLLYKVHQQLSEPSGVLAAAELLREFLQRKLGKELCTKIFQHINDDESNDNVAFEDSLTLLGKQNLVYLPAILKLLEIGCA